jgi:predicted nucleic acid-binding protein
MLNGKRRSNLDSWLTNGLVPGYAGRILQVDEAIALETGRLLALTRSRRHTAALQDALIAATAAVHGLKLATLNRHHFQLLGTDLAVF